MSTKILMWSFIILLIAWFWLMGFTTPVSAEILKYKVYSYVTQEHSVPVGDVEGHTLNLVTRRAFCISENGEVATQIRVIFSDVIKGSGSSIVYTTMTFADGSTIISKGQFTLEGKGAGISAARGTTEIIKGTGRFEGIKGTATGTLKFLPLEKGEAGRKDIGEYVLTYTVPPK